MTVVLEVRSVVRYERQATAAYSLAASQDIQEVVDAGQPDERLLPAGRNSGYLWRINTLTRSSSGRAGSTWSSRQSG
jgi:hypothetical protein